MTNLKGKTVDILSNYVIEYLKKHKFLYTIIAFSGNNCNADFRIYLIILNFLNRIYKSLLYLSTS